MDALGSAFGVALGVALGVVLGAEEVAGAGADDLPDMKYQPRPPIPPPTKQIATTTRSTTGLVDARGAVTASATLD